jgi:hypothetical protein
MFVVQVSLLIVTFLSLVSWILSLMQTTKKVNPHPHIAPCVNIWSVFFFFFFFLCHLLNVGACICHITQERQVEWTTPHHTIKMLHFVVFHNITCYTNSIVTCIHVNTKKLHNITCTLVATSVILWRLECNLSHTQVFIVLRRRSKLSSSTNQFMSKSWVNKEN